LAWYGFYQAPFQLFLGDSPKPDAMSNWSDGQGAYAIAPLQSPSSFDLSSPRAGSKSDDDGGGISFKYFLLLLI
jgi:hypothetical protein